MRAIDLHLELLHVSPPVWRVIRVPHDLRLDDLHHAIQAVMGWNDFHPHVFEVGAHEYGPPPEDADEDEARAEAERAVWAGDGRTLTVTEALAAGTGHFTYIYDFAADWRVRVTGLGDAPVGEVTVTCMAGAHERLEPSTRLAPFSVEAANRRLQEATRPRATPEFPAGAGASADQQLLARLSLATLMLGSRPTRHGTREAWKYLRTEILDALSEAGLIDHDPARKSVTITELGAAHARRLLDQLRTL